MDAESVNSGTVPAAASKPDVGYLAQRRAETQCHPQDNIQRWVATIHSSPFTCSFRKFFRHSFTVSFPRQNPEATIQYSRADSAAFLALTALFVQRERHIRTITLMFAIHFFLAWLTAAEPRGEKQCFLCKFWVVKIF